MRRPDSIERRRTWPEMVALLRRLSAEPRQHKNIPAGMSMYWSAPSDSWLLVQRTAEGFLMGIYATCPCDGELL